MSRVSIHIDETKPLVPVAVMTVNGQSMSLSEAELNELSVELGWARDIIRTTRKHYFADLASKYQEVRHGG